MNSSHITIPPGAKTWQSDVETSHRLIEDEFYACEYFYTRLDFMKKTFVYQKYFNFERNNRYKGNPPVKILKDIAPKIHEEILSHKPVVVDTLYRKYKNIIRSFAA